MSPGDRAAECFRESRFLYGYAKGKIRWDPAYPALARMLRGSELPILDIGCGVGLLAAYLRESGCQQPIFGIEPDKKKVRTACERVATAYPLLDFRVGDARSLDDFSGDIVMLDVLHYMTSKAQRAVLDQISQRICPGGRALIRTTFRDDSWRYYATLIEEAFVRASGWIRGGKCCFPTRKDVTDPFHGPEWKVTVSPMWGRTPFNSHLVEIARD